MRETELLQIGDLAISSGEAVETLCAIRNGHVDAVVVNAATGHRVVTFQDPSHAYRALVETMGEGAALVTLEGIVSYHNPRFAAFAAGSPRGRALHDLVAADARPSIDAMLERARHGPARIEVEMVSDGGTHPVQMTATAASVGEVPVLCIVVTDLGEVRAQAELYRKALVGMGERERLLSIAGHELRAPLQALVFDLGVLLGRERTPELEAIERQALQLADLVRSLLDVGLVGSSLKLEREPVDLAVIVRSALARSTDVAKSGSTIDAELAPCSGRWDRQRIEQVAINLISNAAKYGLGKAIRIVVDGDEKVARLVVEDHGIGVAADALDRLFRPYERIGTVKTATGLGLGLYICAQIVHAHDGVIRTESDPGVGTRFIVELPRSGA